MAHSPRCLVIGLPAPIAPDCGAPGDAVMLAFADLAARLPASPGLELVIAPLFCMDFDALEIIETLGKAGYRGALRVIAPKLPNRQVVLRELRSHASRQGIILELVESG